MTIRVLWADDHSVVGKGLRQFIDRELYLQQANIIATDLIERYAASAAEQIVSGADLFALAPCRQETSSPLIDRAFAHGWIQSQTLRIQRDSSVFFLRCNLRPI